LVLYQMAYRKIISGNYLSDIGKPTVKQMLE
jgi:hypothetical protein